MSRFISRDYYFEKAKSRGYKARSIFKLEEIDKKFCLIKKSSIVLDLGAAPGSWLQYVAEKIGSKGAALGIDLTEIKDNFHPRIKTIKADCFALDEEKISQYMKDIISYFNGFDLILSDMAPKTSGIKHVDQAKSLELAYEAFFIANKLLKKDGSLIIKIFESNDVKDFILALREVFKNVKTVRPKSVRDVSKEFYIVGLNKYE